MFSILIAHYNNYHYFIDCYKSIINQTYQDFEVIIVDDCSTDGSLQKIKNLVKEDARFKIFKNEENRGVGFTKKRCVELASGEFCGFVDPDDAITPSALKDAITSFSDVIVAVYSQIQMCDDNLKFIKLFPGQKQVRNGNRLFLNIFFEANHFFVFKRQAYLKTKGIDETLSSAVDQDLYLKLYETGDFRFILKPNYIYRLHDRGVSQEKSKKEKLNKNWHKVLKNTLDRRGITKIYNIEVEKIDNLPRFIFEKENTFFKRLLRKFL